MRTKLSKLVQMLNHLGENIFPVKVNHIKPGVIRNQRYNRNLYIVWHMLWLDGNDPRWTAAQNTFCRPDLPFEIFPESESGEIPVCLQQRGKRSGQIAVNIIDGSRQENADGRTFTSAQLLCSKISAITETPRRVDDFPRSLLADPPLPTLPGKHR